MSKQKRSFTITSSRTTKASGQAVMQRVSRPETWPDWVPEILQMDARGPVASGDEVEGLAEMLGFRVQGRSRITASNEEELVQDVVIGVRMVARYRVERTSAGTVVTHELVVTRPEGLLGGVLAFFLRIRLKTMQKRLLDNLTDRSEAEGSGRDATKEAPRAGT